MKIVVAGCGSMGRRRIRHLLNIDGIEVAAYDIRPDRRREAADEFGIAVLDRFEDIVRAVPHGIIVSVPPAEHLGYLELAVRRGWHFMVEQPVSHRLDGLSALLEATRQKELVSHVSCNKRFHPAVNQIRDMLKQGAIGRPLTGIVEIGEWLPDWHPYEPYVDYYPSRRAMGGGLDAICDLDWLVYLFGPPRRKACLASKRSHLNIDTDDVVQLLLDFDGGPQIVLHTDMVQRVFSFTIKLVGDKGTLLWRRDTHRFELFTVADGHWQALDETSPATEGLPALKPGWEWVEPVYFMDTRQFVDRLRENDCSTDTLASGIRNLEIILDALAQGREAEA